MEIYQLCLFCYLAFILTTMLFVRRSGNDIESEDWNIFEDLNIINSAMDDLPQIED